MVSLYSRDCMLIPHACMVRAQPTVSVAVPSAPITAVAYTGAWPPLTSTAPIVTRSVAAPFRDTLKPPPAATATEAIRAPEMGVDVKVVLTPPCIFH